jgi:hypothetical protein
MSKELDKVNISKLAEETEFVSESELKRDKNGIYLDMKSEAQEIADLDKLTTELVGFLEYINKPEMEQLESTDHTAFVHHLESKFDEFVNLYYPIFKLLTDPDSRTKRDENITRLIDMIDLLTKIKAGQKDMDKSYEEFKEGLNQEYIYSKYGSKENFEREMLKNKSNKGASSSKKNRHK